MITPYSLYSLDSLVWFYCLVLVLFNLLWWFFLSSMISKHWSASELSIWISSLSILISLVISSNVLALNMLKNFICLLQAWIFSLISILHCCIVMQQISALWFCFLQLYKIHLSVIVVLLWSLLDFLYLVLGYLQIVKFEFFLASAFYFF